MENQATIERQVQGLRGQVSYRDGLAAEAQVSAQYQLNGYTLRAERWRSDGGEIDLIFEKGGEIVFVEVKKATSVDVALTRLSQRQLSRLMASAEVFLGSETRGLLTPSRFDLAAVGGLGSVDILENITAY